MLQIHEEDRPPVVEALETAMRTGEIQSLEYRFRTGTDLDRIFSLILEPQKSAGTVVKLIGTIQDVTDLRQAETALRQSEQRLRALIESANDAIVTLDASGTVLEVNPAVLRLTGEPEETLVGRSITHSIHPDHVARVIQGLSDVKLYGKVAHIEAPLRIANGDYVEIEATASRVTSKHTDAIFVIGRDVTERKRAEAVSRKLTEEIQILLESMYEGICSADPRGLCTRVNRQAVAMLGYRADELLGKNLHSLIHRHHLDGRECDVHDCSISRAAADGRPVRVKETFWRKNGTSFPVEIFVSPIFDETRQVTGIVASFIDITERQFLESELERANRLTGLGRVAATMSHEFNNVLMGIQPFAEILTRASVEPKVLEAARRISQSVQRGRRVTEELRRFTRPMEPVRSPVDVLLWLTDSVTEFRRLLPPNIPLDVDLAPIPMTVQADREQITQVLSNAIINARDAIGTRSGTITLAASITSPGEMFSFGTLPGEGSYVQLSITDDGPGIAPDNLPRIVEPFFTTKKQGTGLGLAIAQQIVTLHGGYLFVESTVGSGTVVRFFLPSALEEKKVALPSPSPRHRRLPGHILLIEDEESVAQGLRMLLSGEGIFVPLASDGAEAMRILETAKPDALIVDISLPDCNGFELYQRITTKFGPLPVVFSSGHADRLNLGELVSSAPTSMLTKPYDLDALLGAIEEVWAGEPQPAQG